MLELRPINKTPEHNYPPFKNGRFLEEYFYDYYQNLNDDIKKNYIYIDIFWLNLHMLNRFDINKIEEYVNNKCLLAKQQNKKAFTICQWDDNIQINKPDNLIVFSIGTSIDIPLPLIVEDIDNKLEQVEEIQFDDKKYLCSFVGTYTHNCRQIMYNKLSNKNDKWYMNVRQNWDIIINPNLIIDFVEKTKYSKFGLAPRGYGPSSFRFFEIIQMNVIPIYIHDGDNALPFKEEIDYSLFSLTYHIDDIDNIEKDLLNISDTKYNSMLDNLKKIKHRFNMKDTCDYIIRKLI
jgi:hypothetical protein